MKVLVRVLFLLIATYAGLVIGVYVFQHAFLYTPDSQQVAPDMAGLSGVRELQLKTPDGERLVAWFARARPGRPTLVYFPGGGGGLKDRADRIRRFQKRGFGLFLLAPRGSSGSGGQASEEKLVADARLVLDYLKRQGLPEARTVVYGEALGAGVAVQAAARRRMGAVILEQPVTSLLDAGADILPFLPLGLLLKDRYDSLSHIGAISAPLLIVHGGSDAIAPARLAEKLYAAANNPKQAFFAPETNNKTLYDQGALERIDSFLTALYGIASSPRAGYQARTAPIKSGGVL